MHDFESARALKWKKEEKKKEEPRCFTWRRFTPSVSPDAVELINFSTFVLNGEQARQQMPSNTAHAQMARMRNEAETKALREVMRQQEEERRVRDQAQARQRQIEMERERQAAAHAAQQAAALKWSAPKPKPQALSLAEIQEQERLEKLKREREEEERRRRDAAQGIVQNAASGVWGGGKQSGPPRLADILDEEERTAPRPPPQTTVRHDESALWGDSPSLGAPNTQMPPQWTASSGRGGGQTLSLADIQKQEEMERLADPQRGQGGQGGGSSWAGLASKQTPVGGRAHAQPAPAVYAQRTAPQQHQHQHQQAIGGIVDDDDVDFWDYGGGGGGGGAARSNNSNSKPGADTQKVSAAGGGAGPTSQQQSSSSMPSSSGPASSSAPSGASSSGGGGSGAAAKSKGSTKTLSKAETSQFSKWCQEELTKITGSDDSTLAEFLMSLHSAQEVHEYVIDFLGPSAQAFANEFVLRKNMDVEVVSGKGGARKEGGGANAQADSIWDDGVVGASSVGGKKKKKK